MPVSLRTAEPKVPESFKETEIGPIPVDWGVAPLRDAATFTRKPRGLRLSEYEAIPFVPMELVPDEGVRIGQYELRPGRSIRSGTYCEKGDILLAKITPSFENGKQGIVGDMPLDFAYATTEVYPLRGKPDRLDQMFLFYFLKLACVRADIAGKMEGTTGRQRVPKAVIENYPVLLPPLPEQRRIAHVLGTIQQAIAAQDDLIAAAREVKRSLMQRLFTYGPGPEPAPTKETEVGEIPEHWEVAQLGKLCEFLQYGTSKRCTEEPRGAPVLRIPNIIGGKVDVGDLKFIELPDKSADRLRLRVGDLLFVRTNGRREYTGRCAVFKRELPEALFASYLIRARLKSDTALPDFVQLYTMTSTGKSYLSGRATGAADGKFNINQQTIKSVLLPVPPLDEQREIVSEMQVCDNKVEAEEQRKAALHALFKTMLHQLMTGQIRLGNGWGSPKERF
jgi:type I restriction enzyme S subunit